MSTVRIGISGWRYVPWRGIFYPKGLAQRLELNYASRELASIEINGTFYALQTPKSFATWAEDTPDEFVFSVKAPRYMTHILRLREAATPLANFMASGLLRLGPKLGPILWQMPPSFRFDAETIEAFLALLPHDTEAAAELAARHDDKVKARAWVKTDAKRPLRHAMEVRHDSFSTPDFVALLRKYKVALVCADTVKWPRLMDVTTDFMYCRLHGAEKLYHSGYRPEVLDEWAARIAAWASGKSEVEGRYVAAPPKAARKPMDVFLYFDNTAKEYAPANARDLDARVKQLLATA